MRKYSIAIGGLVGSFVASLLVVSGTSCIENLIYSLFLVSLSSCLGLIIEGRRHLLFAENEIVSLGMSSLHWFVRAAFGAGLAATFVYGFSECVFFVAESFTMPIGIAAAVCTLLSVSYVSLICFSILFIKGKAHRKVGFFRVEAGTH